MRSTNRFCTFLKISFAQSYSIPISVTNQQIQLHQRNSHTLLKYTEAFCPILRGGTSNLCSFYIPRNRQALNSLLLSDTYDNSNFYTKCRIPRLNFNINPAFLSSFSGSSLTAKEKFQFSQFRRLYSVKKDNQDENSRNTLKFLIKKQEESKVFKKSINSENAKEKFLQHESLLKLEMIRQQAELKLRCTKFDSHGNLTVIDGEFSKQELCVLHGLQPRDLRKIDSMYTNQLPSILVRDHAILVNLLHIRAVLEHDCVILFESVLSQQDFNQSIFLYELQELLKSTNTKNENLPFELRALESILILVVNSLQSEEEVLINLIQNLMAYLEESIDRTKLKELLQYSKRLSRFEQRVINIRDAIEEVLDQDEDLAGMYLTNKKEGHPQQIDHHEEVELLMETYLKQVEEIANTVESTSSQLKTTEDVVNIILDSQRNSLMMLDIRLTVLTVALAVGTFISSLFGMNLLSGLEDHPYAFYVATAVALTLVFSVVGAVFFKIIRTLKRLN